MDAMQQTGSRDWKARIEAALDAHFHQEDGSSRLGTDYQVGLLAGTAEHKTLVRAYLADDLTTEARADAHYQGQTVIDYVFSRLQAGWTPAQGPLPAVTILNPSPGYAHPKPAVRRSLLARVLRFLK